MFPFALPALVSPLGGITPGELAMKNLSATSYFFEEEGSGNYINSSPSRFVTLSGTSGSCNIVIDGVNYLATFITNLRTTVNNFVSAHSAALAALNISVTAHGFATAGGLTITFTDGNIRTVTVQNVSLTLNGTVANGDVSTPQRPAVSGGLITFDGLSYFSQPLSAARTVILIANVPNTASNFLFRGLNAANTQVSASATGTGNLSEIQDLKYNDRISEINNNIRIDVGQWIIATYTSTGPIDRGAIFYGATNTGTSILTAGQYAAIMTFNFVLTDRQFQDAVNYMVKRLQPKALPLSTITVPQLVTSVAPNAPSPLLMPPGYGVNQAEWDQHVHCKVLDFEQIKGPGGRWAGRRYWMGSTPFPYLASTGFSNPDVFENPFIICSDDGTTLLTPTGVTNPLFPNAGNNGFNSDIHLAYDATTDRVYMYWREYNANADEQYFCVSHSNDGFQTFTPKQILFTKTNVVADGANNYLSPVVFFDTNLNKWVNYAVRFLDQALVNPRRNVLSREIADTPLGFVGNYVDCEMPDWYTQGSSGEGGWHMDIEPDTRVNNGNGRGYICVISISSTGSANGVLYGKALTSVDGVKWFASRVELLAANLTPPATNWDVRIYRPSLVKTATGYQIYYSAFGFPQIDAKDQSRTGLTSFNL